MHATTQTFKVATTNPVFCHAVGASVFSHILGCVRFLEYMGFILAVSIKVAMHETLKVGAKLKVQLPPEAQWDCLIHLPTSKTNRSKHPNPPGS